MPGDVLKRKILKQDAVYWAPGVLGDNGELTFAAPVQIKVRWTDDALVFINAMGREETSSAVVYVDRDLELEGALRLGTLSDIDLNAAPIYDNDGVWRIKQRKKIPDRRARRFLRKVFL